MARIKQWKLIIGLAGLIAFAGCSKDEKPDPDNPSDVNYVLTVTGGTYPDQTTYLFGTHEFPADGVGTNNAAELPSSGVMYHFGTNVYVNTFGAPATLHKYSFDDSGTPVEQGSFSVPGLKTFGTVHFISETEGYAASNGYGGVPKLVRFNPSNMQITSNIDLGSLHKPESVGGDYYFGMVDRDNHLFMGITYTDANGEALYDSVYVAVIDKTTGSVYKLLADGRSSEMWNGGSAASFQPNCFFKDPSGDIYVVGYANRGKPSGILKIKNGTTDFDASYFFNLNTATGKPCLGLWSFNGLTFTIAFDEGGYPFDLDPSYNSVAKGNYYRIDLATQTSSGNISTSLPKFYGNNAFMAQWGGDKIYFNVAEPNDNSIYSYAISNGSVQKEFDVSAGAINGFTKLIK